MSVPSDPQTLSRQLLTSLVIGGCFILSPEYGHAELQLTLGGGGSVNNDDLTVTLTDLSDGGSPVDTPNSATPLNRAWDNNGTCITFSGFLDGFVPADEIAFAVLPYASSTLDGTTLTLGAQSDLARNITGGWSVLGGDGGQQIGGSEALVLNFQDLPDGVGLRITEVTAGNVSGAPNVQVIVDGSSVTEIGGTSATDLAIDFFEGDSVAFRDADEVGTFRLRSITLEVIAETQPSFAITEIGIEGDALTLTWDSRAGETYTVNFSTDLLDWNGELDDLVQADPESDQTTVEFDLTSASLEGEEAVFFRVERNP